MYFLRNKGSVALLATLIALPLAAQTPRGTTSGAFSGNAPTWALPSGSVAGDTAILQLSSGYSGITSCTSGSNAWTLQYNDNVGYIAGEVFTRVLTSADITAGSVVCNVPGSGNAATGFLTVFPSPVYFPTSFPFITHGQGGGNAGQGSSPVTGATMAPTRSVVGLYYTANLNSTASSAATLTSSRGTRIGSPVVAGSNYIVGALYTETLTSGSYSSTYTYSPAGDGYAYNQVLVSSTPDPLVVTTTSLPEAVVGSAYSVTLMSQGGYTPVTWTYTGTLPSGLSFNGTTGVISGTPTTSSSASLTFTATDTHSATASSPAMTLYVASTALSLTSPGITLTGKQLTAYGGGSIVASGGTPPYTYTYNPSNSNGNLQALPEGLTLNPSTGVITGAKILGQGGYQTQFVVTDVAGTQALYQVIFELDGDNTAILNAFPADSSYHMRVDTLPLDTSVIGTVWSTYASQPLRALFGREPSTGGIPINTYPCNQPFLPLLNPLGGNIPVNNQVPVPLNAAVEGTANNRGYGDNHILGVRLAGGGNPVAVYEMYQCDPTGSAFQCGPREGYAAQFSVPPANPPNSAGDYTIPNPGTTTDAAGLSVAAYLLNVDEIIGTGTASAPNGAVTHAVRFTEGQTLEYHIWPATAQSGLGRNSCTGGYSDPTGNFLLLQSNPPTSCGGSSSPGGTANVMGLILRLPKTVAEPPACSSNPIMHIVFQGLQNYGIILADNGGTGYLNGTPDARWPAASITNGCLNALTLGQFVGVNVSSRILSQSSLQTITPARPPTRINNLRIGGNVTIN